MSKQTREEGETNLKEVLGILNKYRKWILGIGVSVTLVSAIVNKFFVGYKYASQAIIMPRSSGGGSPLDAFKAQLGGISGFAAQLGSSSSETKLYMQILKTQNLATIAALLDHKMTERLGGKDIQNDPESLALVVGKIRRRMILKSEGNFVTIRFEDKDPKFAKEMVEAILSALHKFLNENTVTQSKNAQNFIEARIKDLNVQIDELESKYTRLKRGDRRQGELMKSIESETARTERELKRLIQILELLSQQYEMSQIESKRDDQMFVVLEPPTVATYPYGPDKTMNLLISMLLGFAVPGLVFILWSRVKRSVF